MTARRLHLLGLGTLLAACAGTLLAAGCLRVTLGTQQVIDVHLGSKLG